MENLRNSLEERKEEEEEGGSMGGGEEGRWNNCKWKFEEKKRKGVGFFMEFKVRL